MDRYGLDIERTPTGAEPVTIEDVKSLLGIDFSDHDETITKLCASARQTAERYCGRCFTPTEVVVFTECWDGSYSIPYGPVSELVSVTDSEGNAITEYKLKGGKFKKLDVYAPDGVQITFTSSEECPEDAKTAISMLAACAYDADFIERFKSDAYVLLNQFKRAV